MSSENEQKALQLMQEAEKKLTQQKGFMGNLFGGGANKQEEAIECYQRAGNMFKMSKNWNKAGECFCEAASIHGRLGNRHDAGTNFVDASNCYKKVDVDQATACLEKSIEIYIDMGRFTTAAKHHQSIAEMYEGDPNTLTKAIQHYEQAADYFKGEESLSSANKCMLKVAQYAAQLEEYEKAISIYEQVAASALESSLLKHCAKEYFFRAALCHLSIDVLNCQHAIEKYVTQYPAFQDCREYKLVKTLCEHLEEQNIDGFTDAVKDYDSISRLDNWYTAILLKIKKANDEEGDLC